MAGGSGGASGTSGTNLYTWKELLPPWTQQGQQVALPWLMGKAFGGGLSPIEEKNLWSTQMSQIDNAAADARKNIAGRWVTGGASLNSPAYNSMRSQVDINRMADVQKAASDFAKTKLGYSQEATKNMLTGLYTQVPYATSQWSTQSQSGGGK